MFAELDRQARLMMYLLNDVRPGSVCTDPVCDAGPVPHMANDGGPHPHPYGMNETAPYAWVPPDER